jgi:hypothetical protein
MRTLLTFLLCWGAVGVWLCWDDGDVRALLAHRPIFWLGVYLSFIYPLVPLVPATAIAVTLGYGFRVAWWLRGVVAAAISGGIVLLFLVNTKQFAASPVLAFAGIGFALGCSASGLNGRRRAEPGASPNGGPAIRLGNSRAGGGPPSVS